MSYFALLPFLSLYTFSNVCTVSILSGLFNLQEGSSFRVSYYKTRVWQRVSTAVHINPGLAIGMIRDSEHETGQNYRKAIYEMQELLAQHDAVMKNSSETELQQLLESSTETGLKKLIAQDILETKTCCCSCNEKNEICDSIDDTDALDEEEENGEVPWNVL
jgi:hypothetical protein